MQAIQTLTHKTDLTLYTAQFQLKSQLEAYGLNPHEWRFDQFEFTSDGLEGFAELEHVRDNNLKLKGRIHRQPFSIKTFLTWKWSDLVWDL